MIKIKLNDKVSIDLEKLIESRMLIQANSGGGKSHTIRRLIEQAFAHVQIIVIDPEGEFGNMRSKFDFVYVGKDGDAPAEPRSAELLARRLLELKASAIIDLYELSPQDRKHFVRLFCEALVNAPKTLWHDVLVIIDEAHVFAPEKDQSEALGAVVDLMSRGRKRGYCGILATQRPAKLNKDAAAECNNKLIGRASLDIDRKRSAEELGFTSKDDVRSLRDLEPGEFYTFGPAIGRDIVKVSIGELQVDPAKRGASKLSVPAPTTKVKKILAQLADLPQEAAQEAKTLADAQTLIRTLERQLRDAKKGSVVKPVIDTKAIEDAVRKAVARKEAAFQKLKETMMRFLMRTHKDVDQLMNELANDRREELGVVLRGSKQTYQNVVEGRPQFSEEALERGRQIMMEQTTEKGGDLSRPLSKEVLSKGARQVLSYLYNIFPDRRTKTQLFVATGYAPGGGFNNIVYELTGAGLVLKDGDKYICQKGNVDLAMIDESFDPSLDKWDQKLSKGARLVFQILKEDSAVPWTKEELASRTSYALGGGFNNIIYELTGKELAKKEGTAYRINPEILDL